MDVPIYKEMWYVNTIILYVIEEFIMSKMVVLWLVDFLSSIPRQIKRLKIGSIKLKLNYFNKLIVI